MAIAEILAAMVVLSLFLSMIAYPPPTEKGPDELWRALIMNGDVNRADRKRGG
jgi:hypothetical protein